MSELTDLEICKKVAAIELGKSCFCNNGIPDHVYTSKVNMNAIFGKKHGDVDGNTEFNPLTDDALCFKLMVKYDLDVISPYRKNNETKWEAQSFANNYATTFSVYDESPNRAICLAIIASKE